MTRGTAVVTGASSGIGEATARRLASDGFTVVVAARRRDRLDKLAADIGARAITLDVTSETSVAAFAAEVDECQVLVNNAGGAWGLADRPGPDRRRGTRAADGAGRGVRRRGGVLRVGGRGLGVS